MDKYDTELTILSCINPIILVETIMYGIKKRWNFANDFLT